MNVYNNNSEMCLRLTIVDDFTFWHAQSEPIDDAAVDVHVRDVQKAKSWSPGSQHKVSGVGVPHTAGHVK